MKSLEEKYMTSFEFLQRLKVRSNVTVLIENTKKDVPPDIYDRHPFPTGSFKTMAQKAPGCPWGRNTHLIPHVIKTVLTYPNVCRRLCEVSSNLPIWPHWSLRRTARPVRSRHQTRHPRIPTSAKTPRRRKSLHPFANRAGLWPVKERAPSRTCEKHQLLDAGSSRNRRSLE